MWKEIHIPKARSGCARGKTSAFQEHASLLRGITKTHMQSGRLVVVDFIRLGSKQSHK